MSTSMYDDHTETVHCTFRGLRIEGEREPIEYGDRDTPPEGGGIEDDSIEVRVEDWDEFVGAMRADRCLPRRAMRRAERAGRLTFKQREQVLAAWHWQIVERLTEWGEA